MQTNWALELSRAHVPSQGQANVFGVVLYTAQNVHICKMLADDYYWRGLDEVSGPHWVVFATRAAPGNYVMPMPKPGSLSLLKPVWREPSTNHELLKAFDLRSTETLPSLVVFAETVEGNVYTRLVVLNDDDEPAAYASLKTALHDVNQCIAGMDENARLLEDRAFQIVDSHFGNEREWKMIKKAFSVFSWLKSQL